MEVRIYKKGIAVLVAINMGVLAGLLYAFCQQGFDVISSSKKASAIRGWGFAANEDTKLYWPSVSLNGYMDIEAKSSDDDGRRIWTVGVYPNAPYQFSYSAEGRANDDIDNVKARIGSLDKGREILVSWSRPTEDESVHVLLRTVQQSGNSKCYWDVNGDGKWDMEENWVLQDDERVLEDRLIVVDSQYFFVEEMNDRFAAVCRILERDGSSSVVSFADGMWKRTGGQESER
ncbi:MAG: hypothetical protein IT365_27985 [Candidatus Hydrogenedentes bacterium]|nr:hypothetical protein [Candidatus Hydrogenedentota bacterium]